jgi:hypothetical protein
MGHTTIMKKHIWVRGIDVLGNSFLGGLFGFSVILLKWKTGLGGKGSIGHNPHKWSDLNLEMVVAMFGFPFICSLIFCTWYFGFYKR